MSDASIRPSGFGFWFFAVFFIACFLLFVFLVNRYYLAGQGAVFDVPSAMTAEERADLNLLTPGERKTRLEELQAQARTSAKTYGWIDKDGGVVRLPIDRAIDLTVNEYGGPADPTTAEANP